MQVPKFEPDLTYRRQDDQMSETGITHDLFLNIFSAFFPFSRKMLVFPTNFSGSRKNGPKNIRFLGTFTKIFSFSAGKFSDSPAVCLFAKIGSQSLFLGSQRP